MNGLPDRLNTGGFAQIVTHLYEFEDFSHIDWMNQFTSDHGLETLIFLSDTFDKYQLSASQHRGHLTEYSRYKELVLKYLEHLDRIRYKTRYLAEITTRKTGKSRFKKMFSLDNPVVFKVDNGSKLTQFYGI